MTMTKEEQLKDEVFNKYFEKRIIDYPVSREGQTVASYLSIKDGRLAKHFEAVKQKYEFKRSWQDLQSEYIFQSWVAIQKFETESEEGWEQIIAEDWSYEENKLIKFIKSTVGHRMHEFVNPDQFRTTTTENGKLVHYTLVLEFDSLDSLLTGDVEGVGSGAQLTDENNQFNNTMYQYYVTYFQKWYEENKGRILADTQLKFLDDLRRCSADHELTKEEFEYETGVKWADRSRRLKAISDSIERVWNKEKPNKQTRKQVYDSAKVEYLKAFMTILNDDDIDLRAQNLLLTNHLIRGMHDTNVELDVFEVVNDSLDIDELKQFNRLVKDNNSRLVSMSGDSLYRITAVLEHRLNRLVDQQGETIKEKAIKSEPKKIKRKRTEIITYDKKGNVIKHEYKIEPDAIKHKNIYYILPSGVRTQQR